MPQEVRMWEVTPEDSLVEITSSGINLERRLESWLESDISMLDPDLMVIGRQVRTDFDGIIDLLCLDSDGGLVVVELKRGQTPREVTTQALDYASWAKDLSFARIREIADGYLTHRAGSLEAAFETKFEQPLPDPLNESHRSLIVAEAMDAATERIVRYLSDLGVPINVATVQHFRGNDGREMLAQVFLVEPEEAQSKFQWDSKRRPYSTKAEMLALAMSQGVGEMYEKLRSDAPKPLKTSQNGKTSQRFYARLDGGNPAIFTVDLGRSNQADGLAFRLNGNRLVKLFGLSPDNLYAILPQGVAEMLPSDWQGATEEEIADWHGLRGYFRTVEEVDKFINGLRAAAGQ